MKLNYLTIPLLNLIGASALPLVNRQNVGLVANEFEDGGCRDIIFIFARASVEPGNMVSPRRLRNVACSNFSFRRGSLSARRPPKA